MPTVSLDNQLVIPYGGAWLRRVFELGTSSERNELWTLPHHARVHTGYVAVVTAGQATSLIGTLLLENSGGDVTLISVTDLTSVAITPMNDAAKHTRAVASSPTSRVSVALSTAATAVTIAPIVEVGILVSTMNDQLDR